MTRRGDWGATLAAARRAQGDPRFAQAIAPAASKSAPRKGFVEEQGSQAIALDRRNKTEIRYAIDYLEPRRLAGNLAGYEFEAIKLRIALPGQRCWFTPDYAAFRVDGRIELHEIKGAWVEDDARVKYLAAVRLYPAFAWVWAQWAKGAWTVREGA